MDCFTGLKIHLLVMHKIRKNTACTDALLSATIPFQDYPLPDIDSTINLHSWVKTLHWTVNTEKETRSSIQKQFLLCSAVSFDILTVRLGNTFQLIFLLNSIRVWWTLKRKKKKEKYKTQQKIIKPLETLASTWPERAPTESVM